MRIAVGGGKGGTGKSTIAVNLAFELSKKRGRVLLVDNDVESPVDHIFLGGDRERIIEINSFLPTINEEKCMKCGLCIQHCPEHALIGLVGQHPKLLRDLCEGCKLCYYVCPAKAIEEEKRTIGYIYRAEYRGINLIQGEVLPGVKQHTNVALRTMQYANRFFGNYDYVIIDSAPGTGANVWITLNEADISIAVTEPTPLGVSDLKRYLKLVEKVGKEAIVVINRSDVEGGNKEIIYSLSKDNYPIKGFIEVPYDELLIKSYVSGKLVCELNPKASSCESIRRILDFLD